MALYQQDPAAYAQFADYMAHMMGLLPQVVSNQPVQEQSIVQQQVPVRINNNRDLFRNSNNHPFNLLQFLPPPPIQPIKASTGLGSNDGWDKCC